MNQKDWMNKLAIIETISRFAYHADAREWDALQQLFTEQVAVDYTSLFGGEPATIPAGALMDSWNSGLTPLKLTQHYISNHIVDFDSETQAVCRAYVHAQHEYPNAFGGSKWTLGGKYRFRLVLISGHWKIAEVVMTAVWGEGNQHIMTLASQSSN